MGLSHPLDPDQEQQRLQILICWAQEPLPGGPEDVKTQMKSYRAGLSSQSWDKICQELRKQRGSGGPSKNAGCGPPAALSLKESERPAPGARQFAGSGWLMPVPQDFPVYCPRAQVTPESPKGEDRHSWMWASWKWGWRDEGKSDLWPKAGLGGTIFYPPPPGGMPWPCYTSQDSGNSAFRADARGNTRAISHPKGWAQPASEKKAIVSHP